MRALKSFGRAALAALRPFSGILALLGALIAATALSAHPANPLPAAMVLIPSLAVLVWKSAWRWRDGRPTGGQTQSPLVGMRDLRLGVLTTGDMTLADLIATRNLSVEPFGVDNIVEILERDQSVWNFLVQQEMADFCEISDDLQRIYGASTNGQWEEVDEIGRATTKFPAQGGQVAFPMRRWQYNLGWTRAWLKRKTVADLALAVDAAQKAHKRRLYGAIQSAIFGATNYTFVDYARHGVSLSVKRFLNADSWPIPDGPNGEVFNPATHTHYTANASLTAAFAISVAQNVLEHQPTEELILAFNSADETTVRGLTGFVPFPDPRLAVQAATGQFTIEKLDITRMNNRAIGVLNSATVWIKPWVPQTYCLAYDVGSGPRPLVCRVDDGEAGPDAKLVEVDDRYPLHLEFMESVFGFGVYARTKAAAGYFGGASWTDPTLSTF